MKTIQIRISCFIFVVISIFTGKTNCFYSEILKFTQATVAELSLEYIDEPKRYDTVEDRKKICFYAAVKAKVPHVDYDSYTYWKTNKPLTIDDEYSYGMLCRGYPDFYVLQKETPGTEIQITFIPSVFDDYKFDHSKINSVKSVKLRDDLKMEYRETTLGKLDSTERKSLCAAAQEHTPIHLSFLHQSARIGKPQHYEFQFTDETETDIAILCRTSPKLFIRPGNSPNEVKLISYRSGIDLYEFEDDEFETTMVSLAPKDEQSEIMLDSISQLTENDRRDLCDLARRGNIYSTFVVDEHVTEIEMSTFQYSGKQEDQRNFSILCTSTPLLYLRFVGQNKIKRTSVQMPFGFHISGIQIIESISKKGKDEKTQEDQLKLEHHLFNTLISETLWNVCYIAQKYVLENGKHINFRFTEAEDVLSPFKLLLTPEARTAIKPDVHKLRKQNGKEEEDVVYMCTRWPEMYLRLGKSKEEIEIIFLKDELSN